MFQYQKEIIINSATALTDSYNTGETTPRFVAKSGVLTILRSGEYKAENLYGVINKTPGIEPSTGKVEIDFATVVLPTAAAKPGIYRMGIFIGMDNKFLSDFAYANWYKFGKPVIAEIEITATDDNTSIAKKFADAIKRAVPETNVFLKSKVDTTTATKMVATLTDPYAHIRAVTIEQFNHDADTCYTCFGDYAILAEANAQGTKTAAGITITANKEPFATGQWLIENLRFPSLPNLRYNALYQDERPVVGKLYTEYSFMYKVSRDIGGVSVVGQANETITRHIYYVANDVVADFETAVSTAFGPNVVVANNSVVITSGTTVANDGVPVNLGYDLMPADSSVTVTFALDAPVAGVTLTTAGVLTVESTVTVDTTIAITATASDAKYTSAKVSLKVIQG